jgi:PAS domain S-box-containing protein
MEEPYRILVVDDDPSLLRLTSQLLAWEGYKVSKAGTGMEGLRLATETRPDLVLLDVLLPDVSGIEVCRRIKGDPDLAGTLVALFSAMRTGSEDHSEGLEGGADEYISRPIQNQELLARVRAMLRIKQAQDELRLRADQLHQRVKELQCLYDIGALVEKPGITLDEILQGTVDLMPSAWQYPEITAARLILEDQEFVATGFQETFWSQGCRVVVNGEPLGQLQVCYLEERPERDEGPFLREGRVLLEAIAGRLGRIIERQKAQDHVRRLSEAVEQSPSTVVITDLQGNIEYVNPRFAETTGYSPQEIIGQNPRLLKSGQHPKAHYRELWNTILAGQQWHGEFINKRKSGELYFELASISPITNAEGETTHFVKVSEDFTERRQMEETLQRSESRLRQAHQLARLGYWDWSLETNELCWSEEVFRIFGRDPEGFQPTIESFEATIHPDDLEAFLAKRGQALAEEREVSIEHRIVWPDGTIRYVHELAEIIRDNQGKAVHVTGTVQDVTERKKVEEALRKRSAQLESLRQINLRLTVVLDLHDLLQSITENAVRLLEGTAGGFCLHRPDLHLLECVVAVGSNTLPIGTLVRRGEGLSGQVWQTGETLIVDDYQQWAGKQVTSPVHAWGSVVGVPVRYAREVLGEEFLGVLNVMVEAPRCFSPEDAALLSLFASQAAVAIRNARLYQLAHREIAEREQAQEELRRERDLVSRIMETSSMGIIILDRQGQIVYANPEAAKIGRTDLESLVLLDYDDPRWRIIGENGQPRPPERRLFNRALNAGEPIVGEQLTIQGEGGRRWSVSASITPLTDESGHVTRLVIMFEDITARIQAEKALRDSETRYRKLVETSPDAITLVDLEGNFLACNEQAATLHGFESREAMIGFNILNLFPPDERQCIEENTQKVLTEGSFRALECVMLKKDGSRFPAELSASALLDESGKPQAFMGVTRDITKRLQSQAALRESEERLRSTLSSMDDLVFVLDAQGAFIDYHQSEAASDLYAPPQAFLGKLVQEVLPPGVAEPFQEAFEAVAATEEVQQFDYPLDLGGEQQWFSAKLSMRVDDEGRFAGVTAVCRDITARKKAEQELERRNRVLEILNSISQELWSTLEMGPLLDAIVRAAVHAIDATSGYICDWDEERGRTTCLAEYYGPAASEAERVSKLAVTYHMEHDLGDPGDWLYSAEAYHVGQVNDPRVSPRERTSMARFGVKSMLNVPLKVRDKPFGYIELWESRHRRAFTAEEIDLVLAIARQLSMGIENVRLYEQAQQELAERKRTEERIQASLTEKEVLLKEIHHRVKNNLQVISSLLDMQSLSIETPAAIQALQDSRSRVRTMAYVHERLYQSEDLVSIDVTDFVASLTSHLLGVYEEQASAISLVQQIDSISLDLDTAIPCGLIINELVSNALKYAFPPESIEGGEIRIRLSSLPEGELELMVSDNGVGLSEDIEPLATKSLGLRLVTMLTQQLQGTVELDRSRGTTFRIKFAGGGLPAARKVVQNE